MRTKSRLLALGILAALPARGEWLLASRETRIQVGQALILAITAVGAARAPDWRHHWQLDLTWPLSHGILSDTGSYLHLQYFDGQGQTLLDYNRAGHPQLRVGFAIVR